MGENFEVNNKSMCDFASQLSLGDVLCPKGDNRQAQPTHNDDAATHRFSSPFGDSSSKPNIETKPSQPVEPVRVPEPIHAPEPEQRRDTSVPGQWPRPQLETPSYHRVPPVEPPKTVPDLPREKPVTQGHLPTVYIDIGHCTSQNGGQIDHGFQSESYNECQINTAVGKHLINDLKTAGFRVVPTWNPDSPPDLVSKDQDLVRRNNVVNSDIARTGGQSIYVSLHHDEDSSGRSGQCVFVAATKMSEGMPLAQAIQSSAWQVRERANAPSCINSDTVTHNGKLVGLRGVNTAGVLIESANVMNPSDKANMPRPEFQKYEASKIAQGIMNYFHVNSSSARPYYDQSK